MIDREIAAFPFSFPTIELEVLEDFSMCVSLTNTMQHSEVDIQGVLFLTSYRLIFVSITRIFAKNPKNWDHMKIYDPSTYVEIDQIMNAELSSEATRDKGPARYTLLLHTTDSRKLCFKFYDSRMSLDAQMQQSASTLDRANMHEFREDSNKDPFFLPCPDWDSCMRNCTMRK